MNVRSLPSLALERVTSGVAVLSHVSLASPRFAPSRGPCRPALAASACASRSGSGRAPSTVRLGAAWAATTPPARQRERRGYHTLHLHVGLPGFVYDVLLADRRADEAKYLRGARLSALDSRPHALERLRSRSPVGLRDGDIDIARVRASDARSAGRGAARRPGDGTTVRNDRRCPALRGGPRQIGEQRYCSIGSVSFKRMPALPSPLSAGEARVCWQPPRGPMRPHLWIFVAATLAGAALGSLWTCPFRTAYRASSRSSWIRAPLAPRRR